MTKATGEMNLSGRDDVHSGFVNNAAGFEDGRG